VDCSVVLALFELPEVLEVIRVFRRLEEPGGRTWRILLVLVDAGFRGRGDRPTRSRTRSTRLPTSAARCTSRTCTTTRCTTRSRTLLQIGVPLWRRQGLQVPDTLEVSTVGDGP
jgi:hypothetical protein